MCQLRKSFIQKKSTQYNNDIVFWGGRAAVTIFGKSVLVKESLNKSAVQMSFFCLGVLPLSNCHSERPVLFRVREESHPLA
jgi:hypothetical protein